MSKDSETRDIDVLNAVISALEKLNPDDRERLVQTVSIFFRVQPRSEGPTKEHHVQESPHPNQTGQPIPYSEDLAQPPKEFMLEKQPRTDVERIACLAYFLTHYQNTPYFKTLDLSKLNTDAAQPKFSNAGYAANNAQKLGYLVSATGNRRQLSAGGEQFVQALPNRDLARKMMVTFRPKRRRRKKTNEKSTS